ncbi:MAG: nucleotide-binding protein [Candidatus Eremiobacteraeota bacterium]|nr:nucleotide-binding protein [Candidatus Eremiobacteraeota bacterium]
MKSLKQRPRIFIRSSSEAENFDLQVRRIIENLGGEAICWRDISRPGDYIVDVLIDLASSIDGALLIATPDDLTVFRSIDRMSPRDNIILELGIFISQLGKHRTGIVHVSSASLPSNLHGLTTIKYHPDKPGNNEYELKGWLGGVLSHVDDKNPYVDELVELLGEKLGSLPISWDDVQEYFIIPLKRDINRAMNGEIYLSPGEYYHALYSEIDNANSPNEVLAVAALPSLIWKGDSEQQNYLEKNLKAAERGVNIRRLFILPEDQWKEMGHVLRKQIDKGIKIRMASPSLLGEFLRLEDMVLFKDENKESRAYIAELALNPNRIRRGRLILNKDIRNDLIDTFNKAWAISSDIGNKNIPKHSTVKKTSKQPPINLKEYKLDKPVVTCIEAAQAKGMRLENELKTLIYKTPIGFVSLELPGDAKASLRKIKDALEVKNAYLASPEELNELGLEPGTVSTVRSPVWDLPHLVSKRLLNLDLLSTNSGNKKGFYRFPPSLLLEAETVMIGDFEEEYMDGIA